MIPKDEWVWYGYAGHFVGGRKCAYHLCTRVGSRLISTVGQYMPDGENMETLGIGKDDYFETHVFECDGEDEHGNPNVLEWSELDGERYGDSLSAEKGHRNYCLKYSEDGVNV